MEQEHKDNLLKLADYLDALPADYKHFDMGSYYTYHGEEIFPDDSDEEKPGPYDLNACGSSACAIGHGPNAGIPLQGDDYFWSKYARRAFGVDESDYESGGNYMFGLNNSNDPKAAAKRIREVVSGEWSNA